MSLCLTSSVSAALNTIDIKLTSIETLMAIKVTSVSKQVENQHNAPAAVYVLTAKEMESMGITHIAEALRIVPGVQVAKIASNKWAISIRGFNSRSANKLQVMIDGRSIYSPLFSGVLWEEKEIQLKDVDRIEVIRGPGGALWGANAVNGVINIITKSSKETLGRYIRLGTGNQENQLLSARVGWEAYENTYARIYARKSKRDASHQLTMLNDVSESIQTGFRVDWYGDNTEELTIIGDYYSGEIGSGFQGLTLSGNGQEHSGSNLQLTWRYASSNHKNHQWQFISDNTKLRVNSLIDERQSLTFQYQENIDFDSHEMVWGAGWMSTSDDITGTELFRINPSSSHNNTFNAFIQERLYFYDEDVQLTLGTKFEHNEFTGSEWQPNIRLTYAKDNQQFWGSVSKAVRIPTRLEHDFEISGLQGANSTISESAIFYESGWRRQGGETTIDVSIYWGEYKDLVSTEPPSLGNEMSGHVYGLESSLNWQVREDWLFKVNYSYAEMDLHLSQESSGLSSTDNLEGALPQHMFNITSLVQINDHTNLGIYLRYTDKLSSMSVDKYLVADVTVSWKVNEVLLVRLVGRHLGEGKHKEWGGNSAEILPDYAVFLESQF